MQVRGPRTLLGLTLCGFGLVAVPLLFAIGNAALKLGQLAADSEVVLNEIATTTLESRRLENLLSNMERNARQYLLLRDEDLLALYVTDMDEMKDSLAALSALPQTAATTNRLQYLSRTVSEVEEVLQTDTDGRGVDSVVASFNAMTRAAQEAGVGLRGLINNRFVALQADTSRTQENLVWQSAALIPGSIILIVFFLVLIGGPMRNLDRAIRELGEGDYSRAISVSGPTDIETLGARLEWLRNQLEESENEKDKFLRHVSHELKTPLANIREGSDLLIDGSVGALENQQEEVADILRINSIKLQKLIENLLSFSAWKNKTAKLDYSTFELKPLIFGVLNQYRLAVANRRIKLHLRLGTMTVRADQSKVRLVLDNLISNAVKFTPEGGTIHIGAAPEGHELVIDIKDTGPGIAAEDRDKIFDAFYQGKRTQGGPVGGTGIGLSIVAECVQAHGGTVHLVDDGGSSGAHFHVRLPLSETAASEAQAVSA
jgi:two-component system sensor histidine kinase GlrK